MTIVGDLNGSPIFVLINTMNNYFYEINLYNLLIIIRLKFELFKNNYLYITKTINKFK